jgi:TRAP-type C4-dicarboxylate transport system permease small subunit
VNDGLGALEEALAALCIGVLIGVSTWSVIASKALHSTATWPGEVIRYFVLFVALSGGMLAAQRQGMFNMDLVTRRFGVRLRSGLRIGGGLLVAFLCALVIRAAFLMRAGEKQLEDLANQGSTDSLHVIAKSDAILALVAGFGVIGVHFLLHAAIEVAYWSAHRPPPEPPPGGHG